MARRSRLAGIRGAFGRLESRLRPVPQYSLSVSMAAPDHMVFDLWKGGQLVRKVGEVDAVGQSADMLDAMGRLRPETVWMRLNEAKRGLEESEGLQVRLPDRSEVFGAAYTKLSSHPRMD
jgi:hypothetical protein